MPEEINQVPQNSNSYNEKLPEDLAYKELGPKDKPPRKIPTIRIIIYAIVILTLLIIIVIAYSLIRKQKPPVAFTTPEMLLISEAPITPAPSPTPNPCGYAGKLCPNGTIVEKQGPTCGYPACPDDRNISLDMTRFWAVSETPNPKMRKYNNLDIDYSFEAPVTWSFVGRDAGANLFSYNYKCKKADTDCTGANVLLLTSITTGKTSATDWLSSSENYVYPHLAKNAAGLPKIKIGGIDATKVKDTGTGQTYVFVYNDTVFILSWGASNTTDGRVAKNIFNDIVSSFKTTGN